MTDTQLFEYFDTFVEFFNTYGWQLTLIAVVGIIVLGILKYANAFSRLNKEDRKPVYLCISIGLSVGGSVIYLAAMNQFDAHLLEAFAIATFALNQAVYSLYENSKLRDLIELIVRKLIEYVTGSNKG